VKSIPIDPKAIPQERPAQNEKTAGIAQQSEKTDDQGHNRRCDERLGGAQTISPVMISSREIGVAIMASKVFW